MDSFWEPYTRLGDDVSLDEIRARVRGLEDEHRANGIPLSGRVLHICHYLPIVATLNHRGGVLSPPATPPTKTSDELDAPSGGLFGSPAPPHPNPSVADTTPRWTIGPRHGHSAMISGIRSLTATHEQVIIGWIGDIHSPVQGENVPRRHIGEADKVALEESLQAYKSRDADPDDEKSLQYVPVWLDDKVAHDHYEGYCKQSESLYAIPHGSWR
jgi:trehalose 6-phosphate synthase/phosphatase